MLEEVYDIGALLNLGGVDYSHIKGYEEILLVLIPDLRLRLDA